jgi:hypothetical protein
MWLSFLLNYGPILCFHEALGDVSGHEDVESVGTCENDPRLDFEGRPTVLVYRPVSEVVDSLVGKYGLDREKTLDMCQELQEALDNQPRENAFVIDYNDLSDPVKVKEMCDFLLPSKSIPIEWIEYMITCNIQTNNKNIWSYLDEHAYYSLAEGEDGCH